MITCVDFLSLSLFHIIFDDGSTSEDATIVIVVSQKSNNQCKKQVRFIKVVKEINYLKESSSFESVMQLLI